MITDEMVEAAARSDASIDGRKWIAMPRSERERYMARSRAALMAALDTVKAEPVAWLKTWRSAIPGACEEMRRVDLRPDLEPWLAEIGPMVQPLYAIPIPAIPPGWRLVPEEPTPEMTQAAAREICKGCGEDPDLQCADGGAKITLEPLWKAGGYDTIARRTLMAAQAAIKAPAPVTSGSSACTAPSDRC